MAELEPDWRIPSGQGRDLGIGIVGCGGIVQYGHLPAYRAAGLRVVAVTDVDTDKARDVAREWGIPHVASTAEELVSLAGVDIVDIAVPPWVQPEVVALAAAAGRHMLCQKPFALEFHIARSMVETAESAGVLLAVNQQMRWDAGIAASRDLVAQGAIGRPSAAQVEVSVSTGWHLWPWLAAAPRLEIMYHSIHYLDALRSVLGDPEWVTSVHGRYPGQAPVQGETRTTTVLEYADGLQALVAVNHYNQHGTPYGEFRFHGTEGALEGTLGLLYDYPDGRPDTLSLHRSGSQVRAYEFYTRWIPDAFLGPMGDLMDAIATGRQPMTSGRDNLGTVAVVQAAYRSAAERRSVRVQEILGGQP
ncbi:MAG: Gfo/Idh/MocA family oxidoreductase [Chloroflexi bacterium]|nr:Gfo/Idh/MocA family oxidoreductase [Chloroflexota bacterium]